MTHKYAVGQIVYFEGTFGRAASEQYEIVGVLPIERDNRLIQDQKRGGGVRAARVEEHRLAVQ